MERGKKRHLKFNFIRVLLNSLIGENKRENEEVVDDTFTNEETSAWFYVFIVACSIGVAAMVSRSQNVVTVDVPHQVTDGYRHIPSALSHMENIEASNAHRDHIYGAKTKSRHRPNHTRRHPQTRSQTRHKTHHSVEQNLPKQKKISKKPNLKTDEFKIIKNDGAGNCLFHCWTQMLKSVGIETTVRELRGIVADSVTQEKFDFLYDLFNNAKENRDRSLLADYGFMSNVSSMDELKGVITTSNYFGDDMALRALEVEYPIHCIVLEASGGEIEKMERFKVEEEKEKWFGILMLENVHYELVQFNGKVVMKKQDLPAQLRDGV